ncbi:MAG: type II toxin-antitoxin system HicB family antitoxin [Candidatus Atribacteria bacterium]|nr:type II toxin-antitoxin system HicB family antitoxin [Candidatus Atribacteria bacterium]
MPIQLILSHYIESALYRAEYEKLEDGIYSGRIPFFPGVVAFSSTLTLCQEELQSTLEDWIVLGLKLGHPLPVIDDINLNQEPIIEPLDTL